MRKKLRVLILISRVKIKETSLKTKSGSPERGIFKYYCSDPCRRRLTFHTPAGRRKNFSLPSNSPANVKLPHLANAKPVTTLNSMKQPLPPSSFPPKCKPCSASLQACLWFAMVCLSCTVIPLLFLNKLILQVKWLTLFLFFVFKVNITLNVAWQNSGQKHAMKQKGILYNTKGCNLQRRCNNCGYECCTEHRGSSMKQRPRVRQEMWREAY